MEAAKLQAWWAAKQGLDGSVAGAKEADVLARTGWARSVGGVGPYLTLFSRSGASRESVDDAVAKLAIQELPSARGCTYVVPASDYALALRVGEGFGTEAEMRVAARLGVTEKEVDRLCLKVLDALAGGPMDTDTLREAVGSAARSLGEEGRKKGIGSTLPLALGRLQPAGEIRRIPTNGRLDQQRYRYALWRPSPLAGFRKSKEEALVALARRYFAWIGPASAAEFQTFAGLGLKAARGAMAPLRLKPAPGAGERLLLDSDLDAFAAFRTPREPRYALVSSLDGITLLRRDLKGVLAEGDEKRKVVADKGGVALGGLADLPSHGIFDRGRLVGLWEYDVDRGAIVWMAFVAPGKDLRAAVERTETYVKDELGDARSFSLDSPKSRAPRIESLRRAGRA
jgi:hypothetical protein